jgi:hypothetical protein
VRTARRPGIATSVTRTSIESSHEWQDLVAIGRFADHLQVGLALDGSSRVRFRPRMRARNLCHNRPQSSREVRHG